MAKFQSYFLIVIILLSASLALPKVQASANWAIYLFDEEKQAIVKVYADGSTEEYALALEEGENLISIAASPYSEDLVAYCTTKLMEGPDLPTYEMYFKLEHLGTGEVLSHMNIWDSDDCTVDSFSADASSVVLSQYISLYDMERRAYPIWNMVLMDVQTGEIQAELSPQSDLISEEIHDLIFNPQGQLIGIYPRAFFFENQFFFTLDEGLLGVDGIHERYSAYAFEWDYAGNRLSSTENHWQDSSDYLFTTGESLFTDRQNGAVYLWDAAQNEQMIFQDSEWEAITAFFISRGQAVAIYLSPPDSSDVTMRFVILDRAGQQDEYLFPDGVFGTFYDAPTGLAVFISEYQGGETHYRLEINPIGDGEGQVIWEDSSGSDWYVIGTLALPQPESLAPFPEAAAN